METTTNATLGEKKESKRSGKKKVRGTHMPGMGNGGKCRYIGKGNRVQNGEERKRITGGEGIVVQGKKQATTLEKKQGNEILEKVGRKSCDQGGGSLQGLGRSGGGGTRQKFCGQKKLGAV